MSNPRPRRSPLDNAPRFDDSLTDGDQVSIGGETIQPPPAPESSLPEPPSPENPEVSSELEDERRRQRVARGRASTLLTGGQGLTSQPNTARRTLLEL